MLLYLEYLSNAGSKGGRGSSGLRLLCSKHYNDIIMTSSLTTSIYRIT